MFCTGVHLQWERFRVKYNKTSYVVVTDTIISTLQVNARVFVNSRPVAALWADDNKNGGFYPSSSIQTIAHLTFSDQVYVMLVDGGYGDSWVHANYNVFTVFLLYEDFFAT
jgi:hypothetical protein